jgi:hypothetical protein
LEPHLADNAGTSTGTNTDPATIPTVDTQNWTFCDVPVPLRNFSSSAAHKSIVVLSPSRPAGRGPPAGRRACNG